MVKIGGKQRKRKFKENEVEIYKFDENMEKFINLDEIGVE